MRAGNGQYARVHLPHQVAAALACFGAQASRDNHPAIGGQCLANCVQTFPDGIINKAAGIDDNEVSAFKCLGGLITLGAQLRKDQLRICQRLGATKADKANAWSRFAADWRGGGDNVALGFIVSEPDNI